MGDDAIWEAATEALRNAIEAKGIDYVINPGDGAFYGPKLDYHIEDSLGRTWQCGTIQLDMNLPERFNENTSVKMVKTSYYHDSPCMLRLHGTFHRYLD